ASLVDSAQLTVSRHIMDVEARASTLVRYEIDTTFDRDMAFDARNVVRVAETLERNVLQIAELRTYVGSEKPHLLLLDNARHAARAAADPTRVIQDRKSTRLNSSHVKISYAVFCLKKKNSTRTDISNSNATITVAIHFTP